MVQRTLIPPHFQILLRSVDSFVIDICISKFLDKAREVGKGFTVFFPSEFYYWMRSNDKEFQKRKLRENVEQLKQVNDLQQILVPVYLPNHWGLTFVDLVNREMYFDDGLKSTAPPIALSSVKRSLELLLEIYPCHAALQAKFWHTVTDFSVLAFHVRHQLILE